MSFPARLLNEGEHVVITTRSHPKVLIWAFLISAAIVAATIYLSTLGDNKVTDVVHKALWVAAAVGLLWFLARPVISWLTTTYTFTNRRFIERSGFLRRAGRTIPLNRISGVDFEMDVNDRLFGCGTLIVSDASTNGIVELRDIPRIEQVQLRVAEELHKLTEPRHDDGS